MTDAAPARSRALAIAIGAILRCIRAAVWLWRATWADVAGIIAVTGPICWVHWPSVRGEGVYARSDSFTFFYPLFALLHGAVREGALPFWSSRLFSGFPLVAEGQSGPTYLPNLVAIALIDDPAQGFAALRVFHVLLAALGLYSFMRTLGVGPFGGVTGGLVMGLGSFLVAQQHHGSLVASAAWLPMLMTFTELALKRAAWISLVWMALAGCCLGILSVATHLHPILLSGGLFVTYVLSRQTVATVWSLVGPGGSRRWATAAASVGLGVATLVTVPVLGAALASVQLLPMYELSLESWRAANWSYRDAIEYSMPPLNFVTLLLPYFFIAPNDEQWSLWLAWEVVIYVGILPLVLATAAPLVSRGWWVWFFGLVAAVSALICLGGYLPYDLYEQMWNLPGMALQRAPARFALLVVASLAVLAGAGADGLSRASIHGVARQRWSACMLILCLLWGGILVAGGAHLIVWRAWILGNREWALNRIEQWYLAGLRDPLQNLTPLRVLQGMETALDLANPKTAITLLLLTATVVLLLLWREAPRLRRLWQLVTLGIVIADLSLFAVDFHPVVSLTELSRLGAPGEYLQARASDGRALTHPDVEATRPNQLVNTRVAEASGYSPLQLERHRWYAANAGTVDNTVIDLWGIRHSLVASVQATLPSFERVGFHPERPLMIGGASTPNGRLSLRVPSEPATELRTIMALANASAVKDDTVVGTWTVTDNTGIRRVLPLRAGREVSDWAIVQSDTRAAHRATLFATIRPFGDPLGRPESLRGLSYTSVALDDRVLATRLEYEHVDPTSQSIIYGVALVDARGSSVSQFFQPSKYATVFSDDKTLIYQNDAAYPRSFIVGQAFNVESPPAAMARLMDGPLDPTREVVIEGPQSSSRNQATGTVTLVEDREAALEFQVDASGPGYLVVADAFYPGWRAWVDGTEQSVQRANFLFKAVAIPSGPSRVRLEYEPTKFVEGLRISSIAVIVASTMIVVGVLGSLPTAVGYRRVRALLSAG